MNRRTFLSRAALALGGALLAPLVGAVKRTEAVGDERISEATAAAWRADMEREWALEAAFAEDVKLWDFPITVRDGTTVDNFIEDDWGPATTGVRVAAWGDTIHFPYIESLAVRPGGVIVNDSHYLPPDGRTVPSFGPVRAQIREVGD